MAWRSVSLSPYESESELASLSACESVYALASESESLLALLSPFLSVSPSELQSEYGSAYQ
jgi:hypothetical protein